MSDFAYFQEQDSEQFSFSGFRKYCFQMKDSEICPQKQKSCMV